MRWCGRTWARLTWAIPSSPRPTGTQDKAIAAFERALECDPAAPQVAYNIGLTCGRDRGDRDRAIHWLTRALQANPLDLRRRAPHSRTTAPSSLA